MGIQKIFLGTTTGDKTGTPAKVAGGMINANFDYLEAKIDNVDKLVSETGFVLAGQNLTMNAGWEWLINGIAYTNPVDVIINIPYASSGNQRIDLIVLNTSSTFTRIAGTESISNPVAQPIPDDTVQATLIVVTDGVIEQPAPPISGNSYVAKSEFSFNKVTGSGAKASTSISSDACNFRFTGASQIASLLVSTNNKKYIYEGKDHFVKNENGTTLIIKHNSGTGNFKYNFPNATDLVIQNNEIVHFKFRFTTGNAGFLDYVGVSGGTTDLSNYYTKSQTDTSLGSKADLVGGIVPSSQLPSFVDDIIDGYLLSGVFYSDSGHTIVITGETGKIYIDLTTSQKSRQYRWSGSVYINITNGLIASTDDVPEGTSNLYFNAARVLATLLTGISFVTGGAIVSTDSVLVAFGKLQKQISDNLTAIGLKADINSPTFTGVPTAPTATAGTNTTQIATTAFVTTAEINNVKLTGNQTIAGNKDFTGLTSLKSTFISSGNTSYSTYVDNVSTGNGIEGRNFGGGTFMYSLVGSGIGINMDMVTGTTGVGYIANSAPSATGDMFRFNKNGVTISKVDSNGILTSPKIIMNGTFILKSYTVATLPAGVQGATAYVTDATAPTYLGTLTGGGSIKCPVFYDGTIWRSTINSDSVSLTGNQTIGGIKTFASDIIVNGVKVGLGGGGISSNTVLGNNAGAGNTTGTNNLFIGQEAGLFNNGGFGNTSSINSIFIGNNTGNGEGQINQIVIGYSAQGKGDNTTTIGNNSTTATYLRGIVETNGGFKITGGTSSQFLKADGSVDESDVVKNIVKEASQGADVTGTVSETILYSKLIPANTFKDGDFMNLFSRVGKSLQLATLQQKIKINTLNTLSGATQIAYNFGIETNRIFSIQRTFTIKGGFLTGLLGTVSASSDIINNTNAPQNYAFDPTIDNYIFVTGILSNSADTMFNLGTKITN